MELLIDRISTLVNTDVSRDEVLRQLNQRKPDLKKGDVLTNAKRLVNEFTFDEDRRRAEEFLKDILPITESYRTSAGPLGTTSDEVSVWENPRKPIRFLGLITFAFFSFVGCIYYFLISATVAPFIFMIGFVMAFIVAMERAVANNKYRARQSLSDNILRSARSFELMPYEIYR